MESLIKNHGIRFLLLFSFFIVLLFTSSSIFSQSVFFERLSEEVGIYSLDSFTPTYGNGVSAADYDNDGDIDLYLTTAFGQNDQLYKNDGSGYFNEVASEVGIHEMGTNKAALWFDYDGDQLLDLFTLGETCVDIACENPITYSLYRQEEDGTFTNTTQAAFEDFTAILDSNIYYSVGGLAAGDIDRDNDLDLIVCIWAGGLFYLNNNGDGTFTDQTESLGLRTGEAYYWQPLLIDLDNDGWLDIYCNVDYSENEAWINKGDHFVEEAKAFGLHNRRHEMGISVSDYNNDGYLDMYITNITKDDLGPPKHNLLYEQVVVNDKHYFFEVSNAKGVAESGWDWGATFIDINNDGWEDIASTNGWEDGFWADDRSNLWLNYKSEYLNISDSCGFNDWYDATTLIKADLDRDGDLDLIQSLKYNPQTKQPLLLYFNQFDQMDDNGNGFLTIRPRSEISNYFGIGSKLTLVTNKNKKARLITAGTSFYGQEPAEAHFGLEADEAMEELEVIWPDNMINRFIGFNRNTTVEVVEEHLSIPQDLLVENIEEGLLIQWEKIPDSSKFLVLEKSIYADFSEVDTFHLNINSYSFFDTIIKNNQRYFYRMYANGVKALSPYSEEVNGMRQTVNTSEISGFDEISLNPNPAKSYIKISTIDCSASNISINITDMMGKLVFNEELSCSEGVYELLLPAEIPTGIYQLGIYHNKKYWADKIIIIH